MVKGGLLNTIPAIDVTKYTWRHFFSGQRAIDNDNSITIDHPRLKRTTKLNARIVLLHCNNNISL